VRVNRPGHWSLLITLRKLENLRLHLRYSLSQALSRPSPPYALSPLPLKASDAPPLLPRADGFFGPQGRQKTHRALDLAIVKFFCVARIPPAVADLDVWKDMLRISLPSYVPASRTRLMDNHIMSEQERVRQLQLNHLKTQRHISISFDGGALRSGESLYQYMPQQSLEM